MRLTGYSNKTETTIGMGSGQMGEFYERERRDAWLNSQHGVWVDRGVRARHARMP